MKPPCILIPLDNRINRRITFAFYYIAHGQSDEVLRRGQIARQRLRARLSKCTAKRGGVSSQATSKAAPEETRD
jgi:hypothetical protein